MTAVIPNGVPTALVLQLRSIGLTCPARVPSAAVHHRGKNESVAEDVSHTQLNDRTTRAGSARLAEEEEEERGCARVAGRCLCGWYCPSASQSSPLLGSGLCKYKITRSPTIWKSQAPFMPLEIKTWIFPTDQRAVVSRQRYTVIVWLSDNNNQKV